MNVKHPTASPDTIELERFLPYRLNVVAEAVSRALSRIYAKQYGISVPEWRIVATLGQYGRMAAKDIGLHSRMHKTKVSRAAARLTENGLLERTPNSDDLRESFLVLSEEGRAVYRSIVPHALQFADGLFDDLSPEEREILERILLRLEQRANQIYEAAE